MPKVSILCLTYNHEKYIRQTLESFLMQKTNFDFEIIIHDDASTDTTPLIIKQFQLKYPRKIKGIFKKENLFSKGLPKLMTKYLLPYVKGEYIALCEGDDYFTDQNKLQIQTDFLDSHRDCTVCFHPVQVVYEGNKIKSHTFPKFESTTKFTIKELLKQNFIQTNSVMYRKQDYSLITKKNILPGDWYLHLFHAQFGKIGFINKVMSVYRRQSRSLWFDAVANESKLLSKFGVCHLQMFIEVLSLYRKNSTYKEIVLNNIKDLLYKLIEIDRKESKSRVVESAFKQIPQLLHIYFFEILEKHEPNNSNFADLHLERIQKSKFYKLWRIYCEAKEILLNNLS